MSRIRQAVRRFTKEEEGVETLEIILWIAAIVVIVAAVVLVVSNYLKGAAENLPSV